MSNATCGCSWGVSQEPEHLVQLRETVDMFRQHFPPCHTLCSEEMDESIARGRQVDICMFTCNYRAAKPIRNR